MGSREKHGYLRLGFIVKILFRLNSKGYQLEGEATVYKGLEGARNESGQSRLHSRTYRAFALGRRIGFGQNGHWRNYRIPLNNFFDFLAPTKANNFKSSKFRFCYTRIERMYGTCPYFKDRMQNTIREKSRRQVISSVPRI